jgi:hypothetical protein
MPMKIPLALTMLVSVPALASGQPGAPGVVRYEASIDTVKYLFGPATCPGTSSPSHGRGAAADEIGPRAGCELEQHHAL